MLKDDWLALHRQVEAFKPVIKRERELRKQLLESLFHVGREGTEHAEGLKATLKLDRKVDEASLDGMREELETAAISVDAVVQFKPSLVLKAYRALTDEQRNLFDRVLIIKPALGALEPVDD